MAIKLWKSKQERDAAHLGLSVRPESHNRRANRRVRSITDAA
jgi:hypothetical protein